LEEYRRKRLTTDEKIAVAAKNPFSVVV